MLSINQLSVNFGGIKAVNNATMEVEKGKITGLIGPNGAGKTTLFNIIAGNIAPTNGTVFLDSKNITGLQSHELFDEGILRTFQLAHEFSNMTVLENLMVVPGSQSGERILNTWFKRKIIEEEESIIREKAIEVINFLKLEHLTFELAGNLSGGQKKLLELGRTMMVDAKIVLLDEVVGKESVTFMFVSVVWNPSGKSSTTRDGKTPFLPWNSPYQNPSSTLLSSFCNTPMISPSLNDSSSSLIAS